MKTLPLSTATFFLIMLEILLCANTSAFRPLQSKPHQKRAAESPTSTTKYQAITAALHVSDFSGDSRLRRVREVLEKAKNRTGIENLHSVTPMTTDAYPVTIRHFAQPTIGNHTSSAQGESNPVSDSATMEPLPFVLPILQAKQKRQLENGESVQELIRLGQQGRGYVVFDVPAPHDLVWECLLDFEKYPEYIHTVKSMRLTSAKQLEQNDIAEQTMSPRTGFGISSITHASFVLTTKLRLNVASVFRYRPHPMGNFMEVNLDKQACKDGVIHDAKCIWYTQPCHPDCTRVWLMSARCCPNASWIAPLTRPCHWPPIG